MGLRGSLRRACEVFSPVAAPPCHFEVCVVRKAQIDCMEPGMGRRGMEAEDVTIWEVVSDCLQTSFQALAVGESEVLAACEARDGLRNVAVQAIGDEDGGHVGKSQWWSEAA